MAHNVNMRTNVNLDDEIHEIAAVYASAKGITLGAAIGELIRNGSAAQGGQGSPSPRLITGRNGLRIVPKSAGVITPEMVQAAVDEED